MPDVGFTSSRVVRSVGIDTHIAEAGAGDALVFLHGNPDTHHVWGPVVALLKDRFHCVAPDLPGFGSSPAPPDFDCSLENQAAWVHGVLDGAGLGRVHLIVHDVGGPYGLAFASLH